VPENKQKEYARAMSKVQAKKKYVREQNPQEKKQARL
jgi:hypothetical protein